jgi:hypothetical protein
LEVLNAALVTRLRSRIGLAFCSLAFLQILGGHWAVLQVGAWAGMIVQYSQQSGLIAGLSQTFDGMHPCPICKAIQKGKKQEDKKAPFLRTELKKQYLAVRDHFQVQQGWVEVYYPGFWQQLQSLALEPTVPPPRF